MTIAYLYDIINLMKIKSYLIVTILILSFLFQGLFISVYSQNSLESEAPKLSTLNPSERVDIFKMKIAGLPDFLTSSPMVNAKPQAIGDDLWRFPFAVPDTFYQDQGYNGQFSHQGSYALDMRLPGAQVVAARAGTISTLNFGGKWNTWCNSNQNCYDQGGVWRGNHIIISHPDGSQSYYLHMQPGSLGPNLWVGKSISQGTPLGIVGYTGYTCLDLVTPCTTPDPHLHFQVNKNGASIPIQFDDCNYNGNRCDNGAPVDGRWYRPTNTISGSAQNPQDRNLSLYSSQKVIVVQGYERGSAVRLGNENENIGSKWSWTNGGEIKGLNNWCLSQSDSDIVINECNGSDRQKWDKTINHGMRNRSTGQCMDSTLGETYGSRVYMFACHGGRNQWWTYDREAYPVKKFDEALQN